MHRFVLYFSVIILALTNVSFQWPVKNGKITATFCESRWDHFHDGVDMVAPDDRIYPVDSGKLLYYWDKTIFPLDNYPGGGNFVVLKHSGDICSVYMHLEDFISPQKVYSRDELLGIIGNTGHSFSKHLHYSIISSKERKSFNPLKKMPTFADEKAPEIFDIYLKIDDRYIMIRDGSNIRLTRHYPLLVNIVDTISGNERLGVYRLSAFMNDARVMEAHFDSLDFSKSGLNVGGDDHDSLFDEKGYYRVDGLTYREGENRVRFVATDYSGNSTEKTFSFFVKLDLKNNSE